MCLYIGWIGTVSARCITSNKSQAQKDTDKDQRKFFHNYTAVHVKLLFRLGVCADLERKTVFHIFTSRTAFVAAVGVSAAFVRPSPTALAGYPRISNIVAAALIAFPAITFVKIRND